VRHVEIDVTHLLIHLQIITTFSGVCRKKVGCAGLSR